MSKTITIQLYGARGNNAVIRMPERRNAGVVVQADTLYSLAADAREVAERLKGSPLGSSELADEAEALAVKLEELFETLRLELEQAGETPAV